MHPRLRGLLLGGFCGLLLTLSCGAQVAPSKAVVASRAIDLDGSPGAAWRDMRAAGVSRIGSDSIEGWRRP